MTGPAKTRGNSLVRLCPGRHLTRASAENESLGLAGGKDSRFNAAMPELTRRRSPDAPEECWHVFYGDVRVGTIALRTGMPHHEDPWGWACGFYPGSHPRECTDGTAATFDQARADFGAAWRVFLSKRTESDFQAWRDQRDWTAEKYRRFDRGERMPPDWRACV
jgi:hypothetical protein